MIYQQSNIRWKSEGHVHILHTSEIIEQQTKIRCPDWPFYGWPLIIGHTVMWAIATTFVITATSKSTITSCSVRILWWNVINKWQIGFALDITWLTKLWFHAIRCYFCCIWCLIQADGLYDFSKHLDRNYSAYDALFIYEDISNYAFPR